MVLQGIKPRIFNRLNKFGGRWVAELLAVLWSLRTIPSRATGYMPFFMVYSAEAVLPTDLEYGAPRVMQYREQEAKSTLRTPWTNSMKLVTLRSSTPPNTNRHYADITAVWSRYEPSTSVTWYYALSKATRTATSFLHHGRGHTSSLRCSGQEHTNSR
jgi:hypothetical protein